jgi:hypothetical protein
MRVAPNGTYENPTDKRCWTSCQACFRCEAKGSLSKCNGCSGRFDLNGRVVPHEDDRCRCKEGLLQYVKENGKMVQVKYRKDPFAGTIIRKEATQDERDWSRYVNDLRERHQDPDYEPVEITDR